MYGLNAILAVLLMRRYGGRLPPVSEKYFAGRHPALVGFAAALILTVLGVALIMAASLISYRLIFPHGA